MVTGPVGLFRVTWHHSSLPFASSYSASMRAGTPSGSWAFKSVFGGLSKTISSALKKTSSSVASSPGQDSRRLSASFMGLKAGGTPLALHGVCTCVPGFGSYVSAERCLLTPQQSKA